jgi:hypothetical protein
MRISSDQTVRDVIIRYPATGPIFLQHGPTFTVRPGELHVRYDELTLERYATLNHIALGPLLRLLNAAAEADDRQPPSGENPPWRGPVIGGTLGYTVAYRDPTPDLEFASVVEVQTARGPD